MKVLFFAIVVVLLAGCQNKEKAARRMQMIEIMHGNTGDVDIAAAMEKARATMPEFLATMRKPASGQGDFSARVEFPCDEKGKRQILWVIELSDDGKLLRGKIRDNTQKPGSGAASDNSVSFAPEAIRDWMFNEGGKAAGAFTLRVLKSKFPDEWESKRYGERIVFKD